MIVRTVAAVFPHVSVWQSPKHYSWVINGSVESHNPDLTRLSESFEDPRIREDLASIGIDGVPGTQTVTPKPSAGGR